MVETQAPRYNTNFITLNRYLLEEQQHHKEAHGDFTILMSAIETACKFIASKVKKAGIANLLGTMGGQENSSGDTQKKLDVLSDEAFINCLTASQRCAVLITEEQENPIIINDKFKGHYLVAFDPLDGSSNIDANVSIGSIFAIWKVKSDQNSPITEADYLRDGSDIVAAGYCLYGSGTCFTLAIDKKVSIFTLDPSLGEFVLSHRDVKMSEEGKQIYSINEGNSIYWSEPVKEFIHSCKNPESGSPYSLRYIGSMVADVHRTILYGGVFLYPEDTKSPSGKLRVLYEGFPMAYIIEQCGGVCLSGENRFLDIKVKKPHQRAPITLGSKKDMLKIQQLYAKHGSQKQ